MATLVFNNWRMVREGGRAGGREGGGVMPFESLT